MTVYTVSSGQISSGITLQSGDTLSVLGGGSTVDTTVLLGGGEFVSVGASASGTIVGDDTNGTVIANANLIINGGSTTSTIVLDGGIEEINHGVATGSVISNGGAQTISAIGEAISTTISSGGHQAVSFGSAIGTTVLSGGYMLVTLDFNGNAGIASGTIVSGGTQTVSSRASAISSMVLGGGTQIINLGNATDTLLGNGSHQYVIGGRVTRTVVESGATLELSSTKISIHPFGGFLDVGGAAIETIVNSGGTLFVSSGCSTTNTVVNSGGAETISTGAIARSTALSGGASIVAIGGVASGTVINGGGSEVVSGTAIGTTINDGGFETVAVSAVTSNTIISGGLLDVQSAAIVAGSVSFAGIGGAYEIDSTVLPTNTIYGFAPHNTIDLAAIPFDASGGATLTPGNVLQINENGQTYTLQFDSTQNFAGENFHLASDGFGGTAVNVSPAGVATGDPHFSTLGGLRYDFQGLGDFVLTRSTAASDPFEVQIRTSQWLGGNSIISATAAEVGNDRVTFDLGHLGAGGNFVWVDDQASSLSADNPMLTLASGRVVELAADHYQLLWNSGEILDVRNSGGAFINLNFTPGPQDGAGSIAGLLGDTTGKFALPDGTVVDPQSASGASYDSFGNAWRVAEGASLFPPVDGLDTFNPGRAPNVTEALMSDTGVSANDKITANPAVTGGGDANAVVTISEGSNILRTTTANGAGVWSFTPSLADGVHTLVASETNANGTGTASLTFTLDTSAPAVAITSAGGLTNKANQPIAGTVADSDNLAANPTITLFDNGSKIATTTANGGTWSASIILAGDGSHTITAQATDLAANTGTSNNDALTLDTSAPAVAIISTGGLTNQATQTIAGTVTDPDNRGLARTIDNAGTAHYVNHGYYEGRATSFDVLDYVASCSDLLTGFAGLGSMQTIDDTGAYHYIEHGYGEGRATSFDGLDYVASYGDLLTGFTALGSMQAIDDTGAYHYIEHGATEGRTTTFDGLYYVASYSDLLTGFAGLDSPQAIGDAVAYHYIEHGFIEGRSTSFDGPAYIANYTDLMQGFGANGDAGAYHYIEHGFNEGRFATFDVAAYENAHPDLIGKYATNDQFLTAYIDTYVTTGHFLT
jgi:autotransporter passenger strand-loop-strand repeat protein